MKKILFSAALAGLSFTLFNPAVSSAGNPNNNGIGRGQGYINGQGVGNGYINGNSNGCCVPAGSPVQVPEPGTLTLLGAAAGAIFLKQKKTAE